ncbi:MAG TPA: MlaD family protein [Longimicrobiales bacterium]|nr:MlaD family protein [Longimicrobiales bacterium]
MTRGRELLVGVVIILAVTIGVVGTLWLQGRTFRPVTTIEVLAESVGQLAPGNALTYRGVRIGYVDGIEVLDDGSGVRITAMLESDVVLPPDPAVILAPESFFGDWQAEIVSRASYPTFPFFPVPPDGDPDVPRLGGYALPELSRLTRTAEQIAVNLEDLSNRLGLTFSDETASNLSSAIANIEAITREVRALVTEQSRVASHITAQADSALAEVALAASSARRSFESVEGALAGEQVDSLVADLRAAAGGLRELAAELSDPDGGLSASLARVDSAFARVERIAARVEAGEGALGRLIADSTLALRAEGALGQLEALLADIRENPHRYVRLSIF